MRTTKFCAAGLITASVAIGGCGGSVAARFHPSSWISAKPSIKLATLTLRVHGDGASLGDINGYSRGQVLIEIPLGWRVEVHCLNQATTAESCAIVRDSLATTPAFPGAATPDPTAGIRPGGSQSFSFLANRAGVFRIASLVDDQEIGNATWDGLQVGGTSLPAAILLRRIP